MKPAITEELDHRRRARQSIVMILQAEITKLWEPEKKRKT
jgi:hypothetical protein